MTVYEKRRDIGILKAVGFTPTNIATVFLVNGGAIGLLGAFLGGLLGYGFAYKINEIAEVIKGLTGWTPFPRDVYYFNRIPADLSLWPPLLMAAGAIVCSLIFSVFPAIKAARLDPIETLRYE
jgi:lipoprotein-releasing system permease protein